MGALRDLTSQGALRGAIAPLRATATLHGGSQRSHIAWGSQRSDRSSEGHSDIAWGLSEISHCMGALGGGGGVGGGML
jgi:hypothetical protein